MTFLSRNHVDRYKYNIHMRFVLIFTFGILLAFTSAAQTPADTTELKMTVEGKVYTAIITDAGDTLILADLDQLSISSLRAFANDDEYRKYMRFRSYASTVFPYAKEAIRIFREYEYAQQHMSKKEAKKKLESLEKELNAQFEEPLKKLTKLQGKIMIKMIEKELNQPMYDLLKGLKGSFSAFYWNAFSKLYSYDLKEGYERGKYEILDLVLDDFDVSHRIESGSSMKYISLDKIKKK